MGILNTVPLILPDQIFFTPTKDGAEKLVSMLAGKRVVEVGAGNGLLTSILSSYGVAITAIDIFPRDMPMVDIAIEDSTGYDYRGTDVVVMARPNRGGWIHDTIGKAVEEGAEFYYIGVPRHFATDVRPLFANYSVECHADILGEEGELLYVVRPKRI